MGKVNKFLASPSSRPNCPATSESETSEQQTLREEQAEKNALARQVQELERRLADAENKESITQRPSRRRHKAPQIPDEKKCIQVKNVAHKFTYMSLLWVHQPSDTFQLSLDEDYVPVDRFQSEDGWLQGQYRDLLEAIPKGWHQEMKDDLFINTFTKAMDTQRSNGSIRVRRETGAAIFRCTEEEFCQRATRFNELIGWKSNDDASSSYKVLAPILFKDYDNNIDKWKIFRNPILMRTYAALMQGPSVVKNATGSKLYVPDGSHFNVQSLWG
ncbi:hypothetical protein M422DRAFT_262121, partial [Sphaerobolus stellatus SS14]